ncbi:hypothetical protein thsrh120_35220 [Rhizobium sp. No.120]
MQSLRWQQISARFGEDHKALLSFNKAKIYRILPDGQPGTTRPPCIHDLVIRSGTSFQENQEINDEGIGRFQDHLPEW